MNEDLETRVVNRLVESDVLQKEVELLRELIEAQKVLLASMRSENSKLIDLIGTLTKGSC